MGKKFVLKQDEKLLYSDIASFIKSKINVKPGRLYITDKRSVFEAVPLFLGGLLGLLSYFFKWFRKTIFDIKNTDVVSFDRGKYGLNKNILLLKTKDGAELKIALNKKYEDTESIFTVAYSKKEEESDFL